MAVHVHARRAEAAARLVCEAWELGPRTHASRQHVVTSLGALVGAALSGSVSDLSQSMGTKDRRRDALTTQTPYHRKVLAKIAGGSELVTAANDTLVPPDEWRSSHWMREYVVPAKLDHFLGSHRRTADGRVEGVGFMRAAGDPPFDEEDCAVLRLVHLGVGVIAPAPTPRDAMPPRVRETFDALLTGASEKEIAFKLGISPHTVHDYVKAIYRAYGVSSRPGLFACLGPRGASPTLVATSAKSG